MSRILLVDRPTPSSQRLEASLQGAGFEVLRAPESEEAAALFERAGIELVLGESSLAEGLLARAKQPGAPPVILFEDFADAAKSFEAIQRGAFGTLSRPLSDEEVLLAVRRALEHHELEAENRRLRGVLAEGFVFGGLVSRDPRMARVFQTIEAVADSRATLLLTGETGTGKTVLARSVHERSSRAKGPFVTVHCGALPPALLESELFGHAKGSFTGALSDRQGKFEAAHEGTIFLDEIATAPLDLQVKLLRVVEEGRFERVGETRTREVDVRVVAASNVDLRAAVAQNAFREDLYWRLEVVRIEIPPLRQRPADVPLLARRFLERFGALHRRAVAGFTARAVQRLCAHPWPGNVRELEHTIERAVLLARGADIAPADLWPEAAADPAGVALPDPETLPVSPLEPAVEAFERAYLARALAHHGGRRAATARALAINRTTLFNKMRKYDLFSAELAEDGGRPG